MTDVPVLVKIEILQLSEGCGPVCVFSVIVPEIKASLTFNVKLRESIFFRSKTVSMVENPDFSIFNRKVSSLVFSVSKKTPLLSVCEVVVKSVSIKLTMQSARGCEPDGVNSLTVPVTITV